MSADMLVAYLTTTTTDPEGLDWTAASAALARIDDVADFGFDDPENEAERWLDPADDRDVLLPNGEWDLQVLKDMSAGILDRLREELSGRAVDSVTMGGVTAFISGGLSWGDAPNEACEVIWAAHSLPEAVLHAAGLGISAHDRAPAALASRTPDQIMAGLRAVTAVGVTPSTEEDLASLVEGVIASVRDSYAMALRDPELELGPIAVERIEATVADAVSNNWF